MADLSTVHPIAAGLQGIQAGIQNTGQLYGLMERKKAMDREEALAPLREQSLRQSIEAGGLNIKATELDLKAKKAESEFLDQPYDPAKSPILDYLDESQKANFLKINEGAKTIRDKLRIASMVGIDETFTNAVVAGRKRENQFNLNNAFKTYQSNPTPENKAIVDQVSQRIQVENGKYEEVLTKAAINSMMQDPNLKDFIDKNPAIQIEMNLIKETGDPKAFQSLLQKYTELRSARETAVALEKGRNDRSQATIDAQNKRAADANASRDRATAARGTSTAATAHERVERTRKASAFRMAVQLTRQKFGGNSLPFTTDSEGRITITPSQGNEAATTFFESKVAELTAKEINDAIRKGQLPKEYAIEGTPTGGALPATPEALDRLLPNTASQMRPQGGAMAESEARTKLKAQGYNPTQVESYINMYKTEGKLK